MDDDSIIVSEVLNRYEGIVVNTEGIVVNISPENCFNSAPKFRFTPGMPPETVSTIMDHGRFIKRLLKVWDAHPDLRFGQLLMNVFGSSQAVGILPLDMAMITRLYYLSDEALFKEIEKFYVGRDEPEKEQTHE